MRTSIHCKHSLRHSWRYQWCVAASARVVYLMASLPGGSEVDYDRRLIGTGCLFSPWCEERRCRSAAPARSGGELHVAMVAELMTSPPEQRSLGECSAG